MYSKIIYILVAINSFFIPSLSANILKVPENYLSIQAAINAAFNGDTILVAPGIYYENVNFRGKGLCLASYYILYRDTSFISSTVINGSTPVHPDTGSCVLMTRTDISTADDTSAALIGFTLTGGSGSVFEDRSYPGSFYREGGGVQIEYWSPRIRFNRIIDNHIDRDLHHPNGGGGGIRCYKGNPSIENNEITDNSGHVGTAINLYNSSGTIRNNIIANNYGAQIYEGGAIYTFSNFSSYPTLIENNTLVNNDAALNCTGGLRLYASRNVTVRNNIIWGNYPSQIYESACTNVTLSYCDVQDGWPGTGNINANPLFLENSFGLDSLSPCIDAGDTSISYNDPEDNSNLGKALWPARGTVRNDMGAFGGPFCPYSPVIPQFSAEPCVGVRPLEVHFVDQSIGNVITRSWDFNNDGTIDSHERNPVWTYYNEGTYIVILRVSDRFGTVSLIRENYIHVFVDSISIHIRSGWNMISIPGDSTYPKNILFPSSTSSAYFYDLGSAWYILADSLENGKGYWLKFSTPGTVMLHGDSILADTFNVKPGWNMIGSISESVPVITINSDPPGMITSKFFTYRSRYVISDTIIPGAGYWIKVNQEGKLILSSQEELPSSNRIRITSDNEVPPSFPDEAMSVDEKQIPREFRLYQNYPNPFNPMTTIRFDIPAQTHVRLEVFNVLGNLVRILIDEIKTVGSYSISWNGTDNNSRQLPSGLYYYRLRSGNLIQVQKGILIK